MSSSTNRSAIDIARDYPIVIVPGALLLLIGLAGVVGTPRDILWRVFDFTTSPGVGSYVLLGIGLAALIAPIYSASRMRSDFDRREKELGQERDRIRQEKAEAEQKARRAYGLEDPQNELNGEHNGEPFRGITDDGYAVFAGDSRTDDVHVVAYNDEGDIIEAPEKVTKRKKKKLESGDVDWLKEA